jgi:hypothetical protein
VGLSVVALVGKTKGSAEGMDELSSDGGKESRTEGLLEKKAEGLDLCSSDGYIDGVEDGYWEAAVEGLGLGISVGLNLVVGISRAMFFHSVPATR